MVLLIIIESVFPPHLLVQLANVKIPHSFDDKLDMSVIIASSKL